MSTRTALFGRKQSGGMFSIEDQALTTGARWFVHSGTGTDSAGKGQNPDAPTATIDYAFDLATANEGDIIFVMPGHAENITTATGINLDKAGITIIGLGRGADIPTVTFTAAAGSITIAAASIEIRNIKLVANFATGVTAGITIAAGGDNCKLSGLVFRDTGTDEEFLIHVTVATTVDDLEIVDCNFITLAGTMSSSVFFTGTTSNLLVRNNYWFVDASASVIDHLTDVPTACGFFDNDIFNIDTSAGLVIGLKSDGVATGVLARNTLFGNLDSAEPLAATTDYMTLSNDAGNTLASSGRLPHPAPVAAIP